MTGPVNAARTRRALVVVTVALVPGALACAGGQSSSGRAATATVLATVAGTPVTARDVAALLGEEQPVRLGARPRPDPVAEAVQTAVLHKLLVKEAERRGLGTLGDASSLVSVEAARIQALLAEERAHHGLTAAAVTEDEAHAAFEARRRDFDSTEKVEVLWASFGDERRAEKVLEADGGVESDFRSRVVRAGGKIAAAAIDSQGQGSSVAVARVALALRREGAVGMTEGDDGRFYVVRANAVHFEGQQWDASMSTRVRTALAWEREREHLRQLGDQLAQRWSVDVDRRRVADFSARWRERLLAGRAVAR